MQGRRNDAGIATPEPEWPVPGRAQPAPEPGRAQISAIRREDERNEDAGREKQDRVLGEHAEPHGRAGGGEPAGILGAEETGHAPCRSHPPEKVERHVRQKGAREKDRTLDASRNRGDQHGLPLAAVLARDEAAEHREQTHGNGGKRAKANEAGPEERQLDPREPCRERSVDHVAPIEMARIRVCEQFVAVKAVTAAGGDVDQGECESGDPDRRGIAQAVMRGTRRVLHGALKTVEIGTSS